MSSLYFDTSALLPYYRTEAHSTTIQNLLASQESRVVLSQFTVVEFASALARWRRLDELSESQAQQIESAFHADVSAGRFAIKPVTERIFRTAQQWLLKRSTSLRTLDALQLACAFEYQVNLVTLDAQLHRAAGLLAVPCIEII